MLSTDGFRCCHLASSVCSIRIQMGSNGQCRSTIFKWGQLIPSGRWIILSVSEVMWDHLASAVYCYQMGSDGPTPYIDGVLPGANALPYGRVWVRRPRLVVVPWHAIDGGVQLNPHALLPATSNWRMEVPQSHYNHVTVCHSHPHILSSLFLLYSW